MRGRTKLVSQFTTPPSYSSARRGAARRAPAGAARPAHAGSEPADEGERCGNEPGPCASRGIEPARDHLDEGRAHHGGIGKAGEAGGVFRRLDAEADGERKGRVPAQGLDRGGDLAELGTPRARDPGDRDVIDESARTREHGLEPGRIGRGGDEADHGDPRRLGQRAQLGVLLGRQVDDDEPVDSGGRRVAHEGRVAVAVDRIVVAHEDEWGLALARAEAAGEGQGLAQGHPCLEGALARRLDGGAVRHRIGERHAELDEVGPRRRQSLEEGERGRSIRIARGDEGDETGAALGLEGGEAVLDAAFGGERHSLAPSSSATVKMSLSPRPERQTTRR